MGEGKKEKESIDHNRRRKKENGSLSKTQAPGYYTIKTQTLKTRSKTTTLAPAATFHKRFQFFI